MATGHREALDNVKTELQKQIKRFSRRRKRDKRKALGLKISTVVLSATITMLLGLRVGEYTSTLLENIALVLGALVTVLAAADGFFAHRRLWILRTKTVRSLEALSRDIEQYESGLTGEPESSNVDDFYLSLKRVIRMDDEEWDKLRAEDIENY